MTSELQGLVFEFAELDENGFSKGRNRKGKEGKKGGREEVVARRQAERRSGTKRTNAQLGAKRRGCVDRATSIESILN